MKAMSFSGVRFAKKRTTGTCRGVLLDSVERRHRRVLLASRIMDDWAADDVMAVLMLVDAKVGGGDNSLSGSLLAHPITCAVGPRKDILAQMSAVPWDCAYCGKGIMAKAGDTSRENLLCDRCIRRPPVRTGDDPLLGSLVSFSDACRAAYSAQSGYIRRYVRKNETIRDEILRRVNAAD